jgi:hypothetical protein
MIYLVFFSDAGVPKLLLTPAIVTYKKVADGQDVADPPAVTEIGGGFYKFTAAPAEALVVTVDGGGGLADADRYKVMQITPHDADLDAQVSSRSTASEAALLAAIAALQTVLVGLQARVLAQNQPYPVALDGSASIRVIYKQGEARSLTLQVTDALGNAVDISGAALLLGIKRDKSEAAYALSKTDAAFDKSQAALGIVAVAMSATDTNLAEATYIGELKCSWTGPPAVVNKSADFYLQIKKAITA